MGHKTRPDTDSSSCNLIDTMRVSTLESTYFPNSSDSDNFKLNTELLKDHLDEYKDIFLSSTPGLSLDRKKQLTTLLVEKAESIRCPMSQYRLAEGKQIDQQVVYVPKRGLITKISSSFAVPALFVPKSKTNGTRRMCIDYMGLNEFTREKLLAHATG